MKWLQRVSIARSEKKKKNLRDIYIYVYDFQCVIINKEGFFLKLFPIWLKFYSQIWLNLPIYDRHLGYIKKFLKKHWGQTGWTMGRREERRAKRARRQRSARVEKRETKREEKTTQTHGLWLPALPFGFTCDRTTTYKRCLFGAHGVMACTGVGQEEDHT
jgi:hypothetical protein